jgi:hypothetical protein
MLGFDGDSIVVHELEITEATVRHYLNAVFTVLIMFAF